MCKQSVCKDGLCLTIPTRVVLRLKTIKVRHVMMSVKKWRTQHVPPRPVYSLKIICRVPRAINYDYSISWVKIDIQRSSPCGYQSAFNSSIRRVVELLNQLLPLRAFRSSIESVVKLNWSLECHLNDKNSMIFTNLYDGIMSVGLHKHKSTRTCTSPSLFSNIFRCSLYEAILKDITQWGPKLVSSG